MATATAPMPPAPKPDLYDREIPENIVMVLRTMTGRIDPDLALPPAVVKNYWDFKIIADRASARLGDSDLAMLVFLAGFGRPAIEELQKSVKTMFKNRELAIGDQLDGMWKNRLTRGTFQGIAANGNVMIIFAGQTDIRQVEAEKVFLPCVDTIETDIEP
jgi:hypothetical protein